MDTAWCILAKVTDVPYISKDDKNLYNIDSQMRAFEGISNRYQNSHNNSELDALLQIIFRMCMLLDINFTNAFNELCEENMSKLNFGNVSQDKLAEIFRTGKLNKKNPEGKTYPWFRIANFSKF